jgi:hypothetical protein
MANFLLIIVLCVAGAIYVPMYAQEQDMQNLQAQEETTAPAESVSTQSAVAPQVKAPEAGAPVVDQKTEELPATQEKLQKVATAQANTPATDTTVPAEAQKEQAVIEPAKPATSISEQTEAGEQPQDAQAKEQEEASAPEQKAVDTTTLEPQKDTSATQPKDTKEETIQPPQAEDVQEIAEPAEPEGIDTLDIQGGGNWLLKRGWWEQAERKYEKTKVLLDKILDARTPFLDKRAELDRTVFDPFYAQMGLDQGRLEETLSFLNDEVNQERDKDGTLTEEQRAFLDTLTMQKKTLEQLALDVSAINKLDHQVDAVIAKLMEQINRARGYEKQAWQSFKEIARELSDEKARELAGAMDSHFANMEAIYTYIVTDLAQFYAKLVEDGTKQVEQVKAEMQALKEKGIDIKGQSERLRQQEMSSESTQSEEEKQEEIKRALEKAKAEQQGFFGKMFSYITGFFSSIGRFFSTIFSSIFGRK